VLVGHWIGGEAERHRRARQEWEELVKSGYLECHTTFACRDSNYVIWRRVEKSKEKSGNELKPWGRGDEI
jgi:hypothetical protein